MPCQFGLLRGNTARNGGIIGADVRPKNADELKKVMQQLTNAQNGSFQLSVWPDSFVGGGSAQFNLWVNDPVNNEIDVDISAVSALQRV